MKKSIIGKALAGLKVAAKGVSAGMGFPDGSSEKVVEIPGVTIFSEVPFAHVGTMGGTGVNVISSPGPVRSEVGGTPRNGRAAQAGRKTSASVNPAAKARAGTKRTVRSTPAKKSRKKAR